MIFLTEDKKDWKKDTERIEADSWGQAEFIATQLGLKVIGTLESEIEVSMN